MTAPTLTEFLLARIAEDEVDVERGMMRVSGPGSPARVLAECEAKRRIVEDYAHLVERGQPGPLLAHAEFVARLLALPFANHPDYRAEEWAP